VALAQRLFEAAVLLRHLRRDPLQLFEIRLQRDVLVRRLLDLPL
jgi:hypothetical protein